MKFEFPEPHALWDAYCERKDAERQAELEEARCRDCSAYIPAPRELARVEFGWCSACDEFAEGGDCPAELGCEDYEAV